MYLSKASKSSSVMFRLTVVCGVLASVAWASGNGLEYDLGTGLSRSHKQHEFVPMETVNHRIVKRQVASPSSTAAPSSTAGTKPTAASTTATNATTTTSAPVDTNQKNATLSAAEAPGYPDTKDFFDGSFCVGKNCTYVDQNQTHGYYNSSVIVNGSAWEIDVDRYWETDDHRLLSNSYRRAVTIQLKFNFTFYGHLITNATIATGGFFYLGESVHSWLAATQYVAPLMANFDPSLSDNSTVKVLNGADFFTVEWRHMHLKKGEDKSPHFFTFQATLHKNGTIVFFYKELPIPFAQIDDQDHPVKVGLSDAYVREHQVIFFKKKTIYEYNRVDLKNIALPTSGSAVVFYPLPTCLGHTDCESCTNHNTSFACSWCPTANRCSDGLDRYRQTWLDDCENKSFNNSDYCIHVSKNNYTTDASSPHFDHNDIHDHDHTEKAASKASPSHGMSTGSVMSVMFFTFLILGSIGWVLYAYNFPHTPSGQLLIRYRPTQWGFRRGEARYTAASIHM